MFIPVASAGVNLGNQVATPVLSNLVLDEATDTIDLVSDIACTIYWARHTDGTALTGTQIVAGAGTGFIEGGSFAVTAGANSESLTFAGGNDGVQEFSVVGQLTGGVPSNVLTGGIEIQTQPPLGTIIQTFDTNLLVGATLSQTVDMTGWGLIEHDVVAYLSSNDEKVTLENVRDELVGQGWVTANFLNSDWPASLISYKRMGSTPDTSFTHTSTISRRLAPRVIVLRGVDRTTAIDVVGANSALLTSNTITLPSLTTVTDNALVIALAGLKNDNATVNSISAGWDGGGHNTNNIGGGNDHTIGYATKVQPTAGLVTGPTIQFSSSDSVRGFMLAFRPRTS